MTDNIEREAKADALYERAHQMCVEERNEEGAEIYQTLIREYPDLFHDWNLKLRLGGCYYELGKFQEAVQILKEAHKAFPIDGDGVNRMQILEHLGESLFYLDEYETALRFYDEGEEYLQHYDDKYAGNRFHFRLSKGRLYLTLGRYEDALRELSCLRGLIPEDGEKERFGALIDYEIGRTHYYSSNFDSAWASLRNITLSSLEDVHRQRYLCIMVELSARMMFYTRVLEYFEQLERLGIPEGDKAVTYNCAGRACYNLNDGPRARAHFEESMNHPSPVKWVTKSNEACMEELKKAGY